VAIVRARTGDELAHQKWVMSRDRLFVLEDSLVAEVGRFIRDWLGTEIRSEQRRLGTRDVRSWEHYQLGNTTFREADRLYRKGETIAAFKLLSVADSLHAQAESGDRQWIDPTLARGWIAHWRAIHNPFPGSDTAVKWIGEAVRQATRILHLRPAHPEARELRGANHLQLVIEGRGDSATMVSAERDLRAAAVAANPFQARAWNSLSTALRWQGRSAEANVAARRAYELDAFAEWANDLLGQLCSTSFELSQVADAANWCQEGRRRFPEAFSFPYYLLIMMPLLAPEKLAVDSAWSLYRDLTRTTSPAELAESRPGWQMMVAAAIARAGWPDSARRVLRAAERAGSSKADLAVYHAAALMALGDPERALDHLERYLRRFPANADMVAAHPSFAGLANHPRFQALVRAGDKSKDLR
jgi:tetratricopeptide (TPR) repeat protein